MPFLALPIGLALPTLSGWLLLRAIEGKTSVLSSIERWAAGFIVGLTGTMYATFLAHITGLIRLDRTGFIAVQLLLAFILVIARVYSRRSEPSCPSADRCGSDLRSGQREQEGEDRRNISWPRWACILLCILLAWTSLKITAASVTFLLTPLYVDDAIDNWNMRGKLLFHHQELVLGFPGEPPPPDGGIFAYPPAVPMAKAWLALLAGSWHEPLVNSIHVLWFLALLGLLFGTLRATVGFWWALLGLYIFASLPLPLLHATNPYADMFLAAHVGAAACFLLRAMTASGQRVAGSFLRLAALPIALLPFTKNEGLVLYFPILTFTLALALLHFLRNGSLRRGDVFRAAAWSIAAASTVLLPWLSFKWAHGFSFGNAKGLPNVMEFAWHPLSLSAIVVNTVFEGNWLLLFPLFFALLAWQWRRAFTFPLLILSAPFLLAYTAQIVLFTFTPLATEAVRQTGYARGIIHLLPLVILLTTLLLYSSLCPPTQHSSDTSRT